MIDDRNVQMENYLLDCDVASFTFYKSTDINDSSPSSAEVKNAWSYTSTPPIHLHSMVLS
jgi:hypothetical protein